MIAFALLLVLDVGAPAAAPDAALPGTLEAARLAVEAGDPACDKIAVAALQTGTLDEKTGAEAWTLRGRCALLASDPERALRAFSVAVRLDPEAAAVDHESFRRARAELLPASLVFTAITDGTTLTIALVADDLQLARGAAVWHGDVELARVPLEVGQATHRIDGIEASGAEVRLLDKHGNVVRRVAVAAAIAPADEPPTAGAPGGPPKTTPAPPPRAASSGGPGPFTYAGAVLLGVGILGMTASGVAVASVGKDALEEEPLLVAGLFAGGALFVVGAGLVVVDQGLPD